jgi:hypothetical protein
MVLKWLPVSMNQAINGEAPELGDSPIKAGETLSYFSSLLSLLL